MLGISGGFIAVDIMGMGFNLPHVTDPVAFLQGLITNNSAGLGTVAMPILFAVSFQTIAHHHEWSWRRVLPTGVLAALVALYLMFWPNLWWPNM